VAKEKPTSESSWSAEFGMARDFRELRASRGGNTRQWLSVTAWRIISIKTVARNHSLRMPGMHKVHGRRFQRESI
jgi:hypothetical protein